MALMGFREYARHRDCTLRAVQKAIEAGRIQLVTDAAGKRRIDAVAADAAWSLNTDIAKQSLLYAQPAVNNPPESEGLGVVATVATTPEKPVGAESPDATDEVDEHKEMYTENRAIRERVARERAELELEELRGNLIKLDQAKQIAFTSFRTLRDALLNVPARIKDAVAMETDPFHVEHLLEAELTAVLSSFDPARAIDGVEDDDDDDTSEPG